MTEPIKKNIVVNKTDVRISMIDGKINLQRRGYKDSWARLTTKQLDSEDVEDAVSKNWVEITDVAPTFTKEVVSTIKFAKPVFHGASSPEEALSQKPVIEVAQPKKEKKVKRTGGKVSKLSQAEALSMVSGK